MIKERLLAPPVQPARAAAAAAQGRPAQVGTMSQPQPSSVRGIAAELRTGEGYGPASSPMPQVR